MRTWQILLAGAAVLIGCGIFFSLQDLGTANDYATIASFFLALVTATGSALAFTRSKSEQKSADRSGQDQLRGRSTIINMGNDMVINGDHSHVQATFEVPPSRKQDRNGKPPARG
jgi:hypothetical protein